MTDAAVTAMPAHRNRWRIPAGWDNTDRAVLAGGA